MSGNANSGRRPSPPADLEKLVELSVAQVLSLLRQKGRRISRKKLLAEITAGRLKTFLNWGRLSNQGEPTYVIKRPDLDRWIQASLTSLNVTRLSA